MSTKLDRAAFNLVQSVRTCFAQNVNETCATEWSKLFPGQQRLVLALVEDALVRGSAQAIPWLKEEVQRLIDDASSQVNVPDSLFDVAASMPCFKRDFAAFTIVQNEPFFLELWCSYYGQAYGEENLYILDNSTDDDSIERAKAQFPRINVVPVPSPDALNWRWCTNVVKCFQRVLLHGYQVVTFSDADEYLIPENETLKEFSKKLLASDQQYIRATGWGVIQDIDNETRADAADVLADRHHAWRAPGYDKTLISKVPLHWAKGSHAIYVDGKKLDTLPDPKLSLVHLRDVDASLFWAQAKRRLKLNPDAASAHGSSNYEDIKTFFRTRTAPWNPEGREYTDERRLSLDDWRSKLITR